jgi:hypothetical protein
MITFKNTITTAVAAAAFAGAAGLLAASPAAAAPLPSYANGTTDETVTGTIAAVNGPYDITVRDARGFIDNVTLHQGTIINPTGLTLAPGQSVTILGQNTGSALAANEIDTPYQTLSAVPIYPAYGYYGDPYWHGGYRWGYGPAYHVGVHVGGFGFGFRG